MTSEGFLRAMLDALPDPACVAEADGTVLVWNAGVERVLGWTPAEAAGLRLEALLGLTTPLPGAVTGSGPLPVSFHRADGDPGHAEISLAPIPEAGSGRRLVILRDVTDQRRIQEELESQADELSAQAAELEEQAAELELANDRLRLANRDFAAANEQLLHSEEVLRQQTAEARAHATRLEEVTAERDAVLAQIADGVIVADAEGNIVFVNAAAREIHGGAEAGVPIENYQEAYRLFTLDGEPYPPAELPLARAVLHGENVADAEWIIRHPDGREVVARGSAAPVRAEGGRQLGAVLTVRDATEQSRLQAELETERARLQEVFMRVPALIAVTRGPEHRIVLANPPYVQASGGRELVGKTLREALPELEGQGFFEMRDQVYRSGEAHAAREVRVLADTDGDGDLEEVYLDYVTQPLLDPTGQVDGILTFAVDVTAQVRARLTVEEAYRHADAASRAKSEFLANMSHELRTPLNATLGYVDLLDLGIGGPITDAQRDYLTRIRASSRHLLGLIEDILDLSKVEAGRMSVARERGDARAVVGDALSLVQPQAQAKSIRIRTSLPEGGEYPYLGDEDRVRQVLVNLLSNAIKFTAEKGEVGLEAGTVSDPEPGTQVDGTGPWTYIRISDTGIGIAPEKLEAVFQPFIQADSGHTRSAGGTGLGLTISREFARLMGGDLTVRSTLGEGSTFTLWLAVPPTQENAPSERSLAAAGEALQADLDALVAAYVARIRTDATLVGSEELSRVDLEDHTAPFVAAIGQALVVLDEAETSDVERFLLRDGSDFRRIISARHGVQRARLGWDERALRREYEILREEVEAVVRRHGPAGGGVVDEALHVVTTLLAEAEECSVSAWRDYESASAESGLGPSGDHSALPSHSVARGSAES